jgi:RNA polymerase sigma-70 factor (sigma-E family)
VDLSADARESFEAWVAARRDSLVRAAYLLTGDRGRAEDLLQDALVKVARRWGRLRDGNPDAYVRRVIYNSQVSWWRSRRETPVAVVFGPSETDIEIDRDLVIRQALMRLPVRQRAVIVLRYLEDVTEREAADVLGVSVGTVKSQAHAALRKLRDEAPELGELIGRGEESR